MTAGGVGGGVQIHELPDGRWEVAFPDGLTVVTVDDAGAALALVPCGCVFVVIPRGDEP